MVVVLAMLAIKDDIVTIQQIQMGGSQSGGEAGASSSSSSGSGTLLPKRALKELERFYGFDKPVWQRYLIWLGIWPREIKHRNLTFKMDEIEKKKNMGKRRFRDCFKNSLHFNIKFNNKIINQDRNRCKIYP